MRKPKLHFEQVPVKEVRKVVAKTEALKTLLSPKLDAAVPRTSSTRVRR